tara:strand:+ start:1779 stop:2150 length:372 start_codon:yes stop_codon:yes gene_type:complete
MSSRTSEPDILIFGAKRHDPAYWQGHPEVTQAEAHFDGPNGWVRLDVGPDARCPGGVCKSVVATSEATRDDPDLYFWGEGDCPVDLFEKAPRAREVRVWIEGPVEDDPRTCWSVGLWLSDPVH